MYKKKKMKIHFIGIGGIGMSGIAELLARLGFPVSGSDISENENVKALKKIGVEISIGHDSKNVRNVDVVVVSSAINHKNPECIEAQKLNLPIIPRAEMLGEVMRYRKGIAIGGTHGKTTTSSMAATLFHSAGLEPTIAIGGRVDALGGNARLGSGEFMVVEADESDGSFLFLPSIISVITNIDNDHLDHYGSMDKLKQAFVDFANKVPFYGKVILCIDDENIKSILHSIKRPHLTYGFSENAELRAKNITPSSAGLGNKFEVFYKNEKFGNFENTMPGNHNVLNSLAVIAIGIEIGLSGAEIQKGLHAFAGVKRRFTIRGIEKNITVVDDYGHHPTEIIATIEAGKSLASKKNGKLITVFQPHRYTRTQICFDDFAKAFNNSDLIVLTDIYAASELPIAGVSSEALAAEIEKKSKKKVKYVPKLDQIYDSILNEIKSGDVILILGAGNINSICEPLLNKIRDKN